MSSELTQQTRVIVTRLGDFWVTPEQGDKIMQIKEHDSGANIQLEDNTISASSIDGVLTAEAYNTYNLKRSGGWQCKYKSWHKRYESCSHDQLANMRKYT